MHQRIPLIYLNTDIYRLQKVFTIYQKCLTVDQTGIDFWTHFRELLKHKTNIYKQNLTLHDTSSIRNIGYINTYLNINNIIYEY